MNTNDKNSDEIKKELESIAPTLSTIERINPFEVPDDYFQNFPGLVSDKVNEGSTAHRTAVRSLTVRWAAAAASIALIAVAAFVLNNATELDSNTSLAQLDPEEITEALLSEGAYSIEEEYLIELLIAEEEENEFLTEEETDADKIIDYLIDNDIDLTTIINELYL